MHGILKGGGGSNVLGLHAKGGGGPAMDPILKSLHRGPKGGPRPPPPGSATVVMPC